MTLQELVDAGATMLRQASVDTPSCFQEPNAKLTYERLSQLGAEHVQAILLLCRQKLYLPAYALLRHFLEIATVLMWVRLKLECYLPLFERGQEPPVGEMLDRVGWKDEYDITYHHLSKFVHPNAIITEFYKRYHWDASETVSKDNGEPEAYGDIEGVRYYPVVAGTIHGDDATRLYEPYVLAKTFDLAICLAHKLFGPQVHEKPWWLKDLILSFETEFCLDSSFGELLRWRSHADWCNTSKP